MRKVGARLLNRAELQKRRNDLMQDYTIVVGHLQEIDYLLSLFDEPEQNEGEAARQPSEPVAPAEEK